MPAGLGVWELVIIFAVLLLLFGAKRLPEMGRSLGRGMREFKDAVTGQEEETGSGELPPTTPATKTTPPSSTTTQPSPTTTQPSSTTQPSETERVS